MGTISSGVGLISGLDINSIVEQLMSIEARPQQLLTTRMSRLDAQRTAYLDISARISGILSKINSLANRNTFLAASANSSNTAALAVSAAAGAAPGAYSFIVRSLATTHQLVSSGFASADARLNPGTLTLESAAARVDRSTALSQLNGFAGVRRGRFEISDDAGHKAEISITDAITLADVVDRINAAGIDVTAAVRGDHIELTEVNGGTIRVRELNGGHAAADLGFGPGNNSGSSTLAGTDLMFVTGKTPLNSLNDGNGIRRATAGGDFSIAGSATFDVDLSELLAASTRLERLNHGNGVNLGRISITTRDGQSTEIDLRGLTTVGQVKDAIEGAFDPADKVSVVLSNNRMIVADNSGASSSNFKVEDLDGGTTARDLGIAGDVDADKINGSAVLLMDSMRDVLNAVNFADGNDGSIVASISADGQSILLDDVNDAPLTLTAIGTSNALFDLGFSDEPAGTSQVEGRRLVGGVNTVLLSTLDGGKGFAGGVLRIDAAGGTSTVDLSAAETLSDVIDAINASAEGVTAGYDSTGTRVVLRNADDSANTITVSDVSGTFAADTGLAGSGSELRSDNLQKQYISTNTALSTLNAGRGVALGQFKITDSQGRSATVDLTIGTVKSVRDVIKAINDAARDHSLSISAAINATGDGIAISDTGGGDSTLTIEEAGGTTARDLNILGEAEGDLIDGSFEYHLEVGPADTLNDLVSRINADTSLAKATLFNDGSGISPYRLNITAATLGQRGELIMDGSGIGVDFSTLTRAQDASILLGDSADGGVLITGSSNTFTDVIEGLTLNLTGTSDEPVTVTVDRNLDSVVTTMGGIVSDFNALMKRIDTLGGYDADTETAGILLGDGTIQTIESRMYRMFTGVVAGASGALQRLSQIGIKLVEGAQLSFDEEKFREAYEANADEVINFFTDEDNGVASVLKGQLEGLTEDNGVIDRRETALQTKKDLLQKRYDELGVLLERKRERLLAQFQAMESALAKLQTQQSALSSLAALASTASVRSNS